VKAKEKTFFSGLKLWNKADEVRVLNFDYFGV